MDDLQQQLALLVEKFGEDAVQQVTSLVETFGVAAVRGELDKHCQLASDHQQQPDAVAAATTATAVTTATSAMQNGGLEVGHQPPTIVGTPFHSNYGHEPSHPSHIYIMA